MDAIVNNPYRILGLSPRSSERLIVKRVSDLKTYSEVGKNISYENDLEFLGKIDRSEKSIIEASKKLESIEMKLFYSLMYFEIKDDSDKNAATHLKNGDYKSAIRVLEDTIFGYCPVVLRPKATVTNVTWGRKWQDINRQLYSIQCVRERMMASLPYPRIITHFDSNKIYPFDESFTEINNLPKYQISTVFKFESDASIKKSIGYKLACAGLSVIHDIIIDTEGNIIVKQYSLKEDTPHGILISQKFEPDIFKINNHLYLKRYDGYFEIWLNDNLILKFVRDIDYSSFCLLLSGLQTIVISAMDISELDHLRSYDLDILVDDFTFSKLLNLSLVYILIEERNKGPLFYLLDFFSLIGNLFKQNYLNQYYKSYLSQNQEFNYEGLIDNYVNEFYSNFKDRIDICDLSSALSFHDSFRRISDIAQEKAIIKIIGQRIYLFEALLKDIADKRCNKEIAGNILAEKLINSASSFYEWFANFTWFKDGSYINIQDKIAKELVECSITYYNSFPQKNIQIANEALKILKQASNFSRNIDTQERIVTNINIITKFHNLNKIIIDFSTFNLDKFLDLYRKQINPPLHQDNLSIPPPIRKNQANSQKQVRTKRYFPKNIFKTLTSIIVGIIVYMMIPTAVIFGLVYFLGSDKSIKSDNKVTSQWQGNRLVNGSAPYDNFFGSGLYNYNSECSLLFKNGNSTDAVVCLENVWSGRTIRNTYIQANTNYRMNNIPDGTYKIKVFNGNNWNPNKTINNGQIVGGFDSNLSYSISDNSNDLITVKTTEDYSGTTYTTGTITLYSVYNGNLQQRKISSSEFFK